MSIHRFGPLAIFAVTALAGCGVDPVRLVGTGENRVVTLASRQQAEQGEVLENSYIVTFRAPSGASSQRFASFMAEYAHHYSYLADQYLTDPRIKDINYITTVNLANPKDPDVAADLAPPAPLRLAWTEDRFDEVPGAITVVDFTDQDSATQVLAEWEDEKSIWFAEPNYLNHLMDGNPYTPALAQAYTDENVWWHAMIKLPGALEKLAQSQNGSNPAPVIAVLDSGVDVENPGLTGHIWTNPDPGKSGCPNDVNGCDTTVAKKSVLGNGNVMPYQTSAYGQPCPATDEIGVCAHGTHVSGIIAANVGGGIGGVCPVCQVMPIKIIKAIGGKGQAPDSAILAGFKYLTLFKAKQNIVRVANSSFGKYARSRAVGVLVSVLKKAPNEVLVVGAAGNEDSMLRSYPAAYSEAISVAAVGPGKEKPSYSNFGPWVSIAAPGGNSPIGCQVSVGDPGSCIESTVPGGTGYLQGTSMACPVVAGVAGLILSIDPGRGFQALRDSIVKTADPSLYDPSVNNGINYNYYYPKLQGEAARRTLLGSGIVDAAAALDNTARTGYLGPQAQRVDGGCGVTGATPGGSGKIPFLFGLIALLAPLAVAGRSLMSHLRA